jgi:hypothetical protein
MKIGPGTKAGSGSRSSEPLPRASERSRRNTSFEGRHQGSRSLNSLDRALVAVAVAALRLVPLSLLRSFHDRRKARHGIEWPDWCWRRRDAGIAASSPEVSDLAR